MSQYNLTSQLRAFGSEGGDVERFLADARAAHLRLAASAADELVASNRAAERWISAELHRRTDALRARRPVDVSQIVPGRPKLATVAQVQYIVDLLANATPGGWFIGPKDPAGIAQLTRAEASQYIDSLKENQA